MYELHPAFDPPDGSTRVWRYVSFEKYVAILETSALYFARSDRLGDPFEGSYTHLDREAFRASWVEMFKTSSDPEGNADKVLSRTGDFFRDFGRTVYVNCWHMSEHELDAMWRIYGADRGIAIRSTFDDLVLSLSDSNWISAGAVRYIDHERQRTPNPHNLFSTYTQKKLSYKYEQEVRVIVTRGADEVLNGEPTPDGVSIATQLHRLMQRVFVSPYAESWFYELVKSVTERYGLEVPICQSDLRNGRIL